MLTLIMFALSFVMVVAGVFAGPEWPWWYLLIVPVGSMVVKVFIKDRLFSRIVYMYPIYGFAIITTWHMFEKPYGPIIAVIAFLLVLASEVFEI